MKPPGRGRTRFLAPELNYGAATTPAVRPAPTLALTAALLLAAAPLAAAPAAADSPHVVAVVPNPATDGDAGEHVVIHPAGAGNLTLADGETSVPVPATDAPVALASDPAAARTLTDHRVVAA